jgi:hypothetical protein
MSFTQTVGSNCSSPLMPGLAANSTLRTWSRAHALRMPELGLQLIWSAEAEADLLEIWRGGAVRFSPETAEMRLTLERR